MHSNGISTNNNNNSKNNSNNENNKLCPYPTSKSQPFSVSSSLRSELIAERQNMMNVWSVKAEHLLIWPKL